MRSKTKIHISTENYNDNVLVVVCLFLGPRKGMTHVGGDDRRPRNNEIEFARWIFCLLKPRPSVIIWCLRFFWIQHLGDS